MRLVQFKGYLLIPVHGAHEEQWLEVVAPNGVYIVALHSEKEAIKFVNERLAAHEEAKLSAEGWP